jgi:hypothetical protein
LIRNVELLSSHCEGWVAIRGIFFGEWAAGCLLSGWLCAEVFRLIRECHSGEEEIQEAPDGDSRRFQRGVFEFRILEGSEHALGFLAESVRDG